MGTLSAELREFLDSQPVGVLATIDGAARPHQSLVYFARDGERLLISTLRERLKARHVGRTNWASLCVMGHAPPFPSATFSGRAEILTEGIGPATASIARRITGADEAPEPLSDAVLAEAGRVIMAIHVDRVTAANYIGAPSAG